jgi:hypothetical protein
MPDYSDNSFRAAIKALDDVVAPAVDRTNPLAVEQLRLVSQFLSFYRSRRPSILAYERAELELYRELSLELHAIVPDAHSELRNALLDAATKARSAGDGADANIVASLTSELTELISQLVDALQGAEPRVRREAERMIVERSGAVLELKRAWFSPLGFESVSGADRTLESLLSADRRQT